MSNFNSDGSTNNDWEDRGEVAWNEFDWERYLREQDEAITRYRGFYDASESRTDRIDAVADLMGWDIADWTDDIDDSSVRPPASVAAKGSEHVAPNPVARGCSAKRISTQRRTCGAGDSRTRLR